MKDTVAYRLKSLRISRGWTLEKLAEKLHNRVTKQAISKYEQGKMLPDQSIIDALAEVFDVDPSYFFSPTKITQDQITFRPNHYLGKRAQETLKVIVVEKLEPYFELEQMLQIDSSFVNPIEELEIWGPNEMEEAVNELRRIWKVGNQPILNLFDLLESYEVKILDGSFNKIAVDAIALTIEDYGPVIAVQNNLTDLEKRLAVLRELGFILFSNFVEASDHLCHYFAAAFLLPKDVMINQLGRSRKHISINELMIIQERYGVPLTTIIERGALLGIFPVTLSNRFKKWKQHHNKGLPAKYAGAFSLKDKSMRFDQLLVRAISENLVSLDQAAEMSDRSSEEIRTELKIL